MRHLANAFTHTVNPTSSANGLVADERALNDDVAAGRLTQDQASEGTWMLASAIPQAMDRETIHGPSSIPATLEDAVKAHLKSAFAHVGDQNASIESIEQDQSDLEGDVDRGALSYLQAYGARERLGMARRRKKETAYLRGPESHRTSWPPG